LENTLMSTPVSLDPASAPAVADTGLMTTAISFSPDGGFFLYPILFVSASGLGIAN